MLTLLSTGEVGTIKDVNLAPIDRGPVIAVANRTDPQSVFVRS